VSADHALLADDTKARRDALDPSRSFIVQAPAGSGKTELLIQRYLRLLATVDSPEEILAITFTRKAALEMRLRVIDALRSARHGSVGSSDHEKLTLALASNVLARDRAHDWQLVESPARMRIETVDAFGAGIARSLPLSSGLGGTGSTVADAEMNAIYREAAAATLEYLASDDASAAVVERVLGHLDNNTGLYIGYLARMLASREQWLGITGSGRVEKDAAGAVRRRLENNIADVINRHLALLVALLPPICAEELPALLQYAGRNLVEGGLTGHGLTRFRDSFRLPAAVAAERERWQAIADLLLTQKGEWRRQVNKNDGFPAADKTRKQQLLDVIEAMRDLHDLRECLDQARRLPAPEYPDEQWQVLLALFELLPMAVVELRRLFGERGISDHNEVALAAGRALGSADEPGEVALMLDYRLRHLLIDEMQDTSIGQYELLKRLTVGWTPGDGRTIFCVGDPMQSIYRFRDAEVGEFLLAKRNGIGSVRLEPLTLRRNFRSGEHLVHWFNTVFLQIMPLKDDIAVGAISYAESVPVADKSGQGGQCLHALIDVSAEQEAEHSLDIVRRCLAENGDENVAVLVRSRSQLADLLPQLRHAGIEYEAVEIDRLTDLPEIVDLIALTRAACHEGDRLAWLALLRGPWAGLRWNDLLALTTNSGKQTVRELCVDQVRVERLSADGQNRLGRLLTILEPLLKRDMLRSLAERIELAWCALGGPAMLTSNEQVDNVYRYFETLEKIGSSGTLDDVAELEQRLDEERVSSTVGPSCRLQIMTMHKAKGLQFDHVILHGLGRRTRGDSREVLSWLNLPDERGHGEMIISPVGPRAALENDPLHQFIESTEQEKTRLELDRLLYVACTRARKSLHLVGGVGVSADGESLRKPEAGSLLSRLWPAVERDYERAFAAWQQRAGLRDANRSWDNEHLVNPLLRRFAISWTPPTVDAVPAMSQAAPAGEQTPVDFYWVGAAARHAGTIVHRWLQRISDRHFEVSAGQLEDLRPISRRWALNLGVAGADLDDVCQRVEQAIAGVLGDERGRWIIYGKGASELPVTGIVDGRMESIVIDRVRIDDDGTHWVIDYKTSSHEGGDLGGFLDQEAGRYRDQLARYAELYGRLTGERIRTALYFPLLQAFREVVT